jgi:hypothetical protein
MRLVVFRPSPRYGGNAAPKLLVNPVQQSLTIQFEH